MGTIIRHTLSIFVIFSLWQCKVDQQSKFGTSIATDQGNMTAGDQLFQQYCSACHNFQQHGIGPQLGGLTRSIETSWIKAFINNPSQLMNQGDDRANQLLEEYGTRMPAFSHLDQEEVNDILAYMHSFGMPDDPEEQIDLSIVEDPVQDSVPLSDVVVALELFAQIIATADKSPLARINKMDCSPDGRLFVVDLRGYLYQIIDAKAEIYLDLKMHQPNFVDQPGLGTGFGSFAFHPDFSNNGLFYTTHSEKAGSAPPDDVLDQSAPFAIQYVLKEWKATDPYANKYAGVSRELLRMDMVTGKHGFQEIAFNPAAEDYDDDFGNLYLAIGDGGSVEDGLPNFSHHQGKHLWSSILRIDPATRNSKNGKYGIPKDNPFVGQQNIRHEIWAYGFRNPNQLSWDYDGNMYATDIGLRQIEEINKIQPGHFYGWPIREGRFFLNHKGNMSKVYELPPDESKWDIRYPIVELDHDETRAIIGGEFYYGTELPGLNESYLFGDITSGKLFYTPISEMASNEVSSVFEWRLSYQGKPTTLRELCDCNRFDLRFGQDCEGNFYITSKADGKIYRMVKSSPSI